ncbi:MAG: LSM domain-containing protein [Haloquadratum sp.]
MSGRPLDVLEAALEDVVTVTLKDGTAYYGTLAGYDQHMNAVLEPASDLDEDALLTELDVTAVEDTTIIRGDNVVTIRT